MLLAAVVASLACLPGLVASAESARLARLLREVRAWTSRGVELEAMVIEVWQEACGGSAAGGAPEADSGQRALSHGRHSPAEGETSWQAATAPPKDFAGRDRVDGFVGPPLRWPEPLRSWAVVTAVRGAGEVKAGGAAQEGDLAEQPRLEGLDGRWPRRLDSSSGESDASTTSGNPAVEAGGHGEELAAALNDGASPIAGGQTVASAASQPDSVSELGVESGSSTPTGSASAGWGSNGDEPATQPLLGVDRNGKGFMERPCKEFLAGGLLCHTEKAIHWMLAGPLLNLVTLIIAGAGCTVLNTWGHFNEVFHLYGEPYRTFLSALVVLNLYHLPLLTHIHVPPAILSYVFILLQVSISEVSKTCNKEQISKWREKYWNSENWPSEAGTSTAVSAALSEPSEEVPPTHMATNSWLLGKWYNDGKLPNKGSSADMVVTNQYRAISVPVTRVCMFFFAQFSLMLFYTYETLRPERDLAPDGFSCARWFVAVCVCFIGAEGQVGGQYGSLYFDLIIKYADTNQYLAENPKSHHIPVGGITFKKEWQLRKGMAWLVNGVFRTLILGTAPVLLAASSPLAFVTNSMAFFFITALDDLDSPRSLRHEVNRTILDAKALLRNENRGIERFVANATYAALGPVDAATSSSDGE